MPPFSDIERHISSCGNKEDGEGLLRQGSLQNSLFLLYEHNFFKERDGKIL
jgi:hypothetical protein